MAKVKLEKLRESWQERVAAFRASGQTGFQWCTAHQLKEHQLWYWVRRFPVNPPSPSSKPHFVPVQIQEQNPDVACIPLLVRVGQAAIEVHPGYDAELLRHLVQTLAAPC